MTAPVAQIAADAAACLSALDARVPVFGPIFHDHAWTILLAVAATELTPRRQCRRQVAAITGAWTTGTRYIVRLEQAGLLRREPDPCRRNRHIIRLTDRAWSGLARYFEFVRTAPGKEAEFVSVRRADLHDCVRRLRDLVA